MLELRPSCENCNQALAPDSTAAMICSYECTFCKTCVEGVLENVCPNCGGGFCPRPVRPQHDHKNGNYLGNDSASKIIKHKPVNETLHREFARKLKTIPQEQR